MGVNMSGCAIQHISSACTVQLMPDVAAPTDTQKIKSSARVNLCAAAHPRPHSFRPPPNDMAATGREFSFGERLYQQV